jgi:hypothetical protein
MPENTPIGVPIRVATPTIASEPKIALDRPPPSEFGPGCDCVSNAHDMPPAPSATVSNRIQTSQNTPNTIAPKASVSATVLTRLRRMCMARRGPETAEMLVMRGLLRSA